MIIRCVDMAGNRSCSALPFRRINGILSHKLLQKYGLYMRVRLFQGSQLSSRFHPVLAGVFSIALAGASLGPALAETSASSITSADGIAKPTMALNLGPVAPRGTNLPFIDLMKMSGTFRTDDWDRLDDQYLDAAGWPTAIPAGTTKLISLFTFAKRDIAPPTAIPTRYVLFFEGTGKLGVQGGRVITQSEGRIELTFDGTRQLQIQILATDPEKTGDNLRNIRLIREDQIALHEAGAIFNPDWLEIVADARQFRFMDWMKTNGSKVSDWTDLVSADYASWARKGVPLEVMVALANQTGADPWFTMPHLATDNYVREFATYVRDHLDPDLITTVEYTNEAWNNAFPQTRWMHDKAKEEFATEKAWSHDYYAKRATEVALIWKDVFGAEADTRLVATLSTQTANPRVANRILRARTWRKSGDAGFVAPKTVFDALAVTTYFGGALVRRDESRDALLAAIKDPKVDADQYVFDLMMTAPDQGSNKRLQNAWAENAEIARDAGLKLIAYEGGQHLHHSFSTKIPKEDLEVLTGFLTDFVRTEYMVELYQANWDAWRRVSDGPYMQFYDVSAPTKWGSWGLLASLTDTTPRATYAFERSATEDTWWEDLRSGAQALQGRTLFAEDAGETLLGTVQEDFLIGAAGDDTLVGGRGNDGLHGGDGTDIAVLAGSPEDYTIHAEGAGWRLEGPDGSDFLIAVEKLKFDAGAVLDVTAFATGKPN